MTTQIRNRLDEQFNEYRIVRKMHDVPPHEVFEVEVDGRRAVIKYDVGPTGKAGTAGMVIEFLERHTTTPVPSILARGEDYYVAAWHPAAPVPDAAGTADESWATAAGRGLATLHDETEHVVDGYGRFVGVTADRLYAPHQRWHDAAIAYVDGYRPTMKQHGHADLADRVLQLFERRPELFDDAGPSVCCHGWATPEHVSVIDDMVACFVDFEHAIAAPGEFDYWRTVIPTFGSDEHDVLRAFRRGYEAVRPFESGFERRKRLYTMLNVVYFFESLYVQDQHESQETSRRARVLRDRLTTLIDELAAG